MTENFFKVRKSIKQVEESTDIAPKFGNNGLIHQEYSGSVF